MQKKSKTGKHCSPDPSLYVTNIFFTSNIFAVLCFTPNVFLSPPLVFDPNRLYMSLYYRLMVLHCLEIPPIIPKLSI